MASVSTSEPVSTGSSLKTTSSALRRRARPDDPYVGPRPFRAGEMLYGRDRESEELTNQLLAERLVLLCSPSGAGKTSLIQAKVIPAMREERFPVPSKYGADAAKAEPLVIRAGAECKLDPKRETLLGMNRYLLATLLKLEEAWDEEHQLPDATLAEVNLDAYLTKRYPTAPPGPDGTALFRPLLLIFDQFEEVLTADPTDDTAKREFFRQLGQALRDRDRWALFAIREDFAAALDPYVRLIPTRLSSTYRLDFLRVNDAEPHGADDVLDAIRKPPLAKGVEFKLDAAQAVVEDLRQIHWLKPDGVIVRKPGPCVEPVHLQVVCRELWERRADERAITLEDLQRLKEGEAEHGLSGVDAALARYYAERVAQAAAVGGTSEWRLRSWFGRVLISPQGVRRAMLSSDAKTHGVTPEALTLLTNAYLVRADPRHASTYFELAHDRLIQPVRRNNAAWRARHGSTFQQRAELWEEERTRPGGRPDGQLVTGPALGELEDWVEANPDQVEQSDQMFLAACREADRRRGRRNVKFLTGAVIAALLALGIMGGLTWWARDQSDLADEAAKNARDEKERADEKAKDATFSEHVIRAKAFVETNPREAAESAKLLMTKANEFSPELRSRKLQEVESILRDVAPKLGRSDRVLPGQVGPARVIAFSPDGKYLVSGGVDGALRAWLVPTLGRVYRDPEVIYQFKGPVTALGFQRSTTTEPVCAAGSEDGEVQVFQLRCLCDEPDQPVLIEGEELSEKPLQLRSGVTSIAFGRKNEIAAGSADGVTMLWNYVDNQRTPLRRHDGSVTVVAFPTIPMRVYTAGSDGRVINTDLANLQSSSPNPDEAGITALAISPNALWLGVGTRREASLRAMSPETKLATGRKLSLTGESVSVLAFSRDSHWFYVGTDVGNGHLYRLSDSPGAEITLKGHSGRITSVAFSYSAEGGRAWLVTGSADATARVWNLSSAAPVGTLLRGHAGPITAVAVSPDGRSIVTSSLDGSVRVWDRKQLDDPKINRLLEPRVLPHHEEVRAAALRGRPDGGWSLAATATRDGKVYVWYPDKDGANYMPDEKRSGGLSAEKRPPNLPAARVASPLAMALETGDALVTAFDDGRVYRWKAAELAAGAAPAAPAEIPLRGATKLENRIDYRLALSADAGRFARANFPSLADGRKLQLWDLTRSDAAPGEAQLRVKPNALALDVKSGLVAIAIGSELQVLKNDAQRPPKLLRSIDLIENLSRTPARSVRLLAFSQDSRWLASVHRPGVVCLWDLQDASRAPITIKVGDKPQSDVYAVTFAPGQRQLLIAGSLDGLIRAWDLPELTKPNAQQAYLAPVLLQGHEGRITSLVASSDGQLLISTSSDGTARIWTLGLERLLRRTEELLEKLTQATPAVTAD